MKNVLQIAGLFALLAVLPCARASELAGTWQGAFDFNGNSVPLTFNLKSTGGIVTGTVEGLPTTPAEIHDGQVAGNTVSFWVNTDYQGQSYKLVYRGMVSVAGDEIAFTFGTEDESWGMELTARKSAEAAVASSGPDVTGNWQGAFDFNGNSVPLTFNLKSTGGIVTGTVEGLPTTPAEIHDGQVAGNTVSFWVNTDYQGESYKLRYEGKVTGGQIAFIFGTEDDSWSTELIAVKSSINH